MTCMIKRQKYERHCKNYAEGMSYMWSFLFSPGDSNKFILIPVPPPNTKKKVKISKLFPCMSKTVILTEHYIFWKDFFKEFIIKPHQSYINNTLHAQKKHPFLHLRASCLETGMATIHVPQINPNHYSVSLC